MVQGLLFPESEQSSFNGDTYGTNGLLTKPISSKNPCYDSLNPHHSGGCDDFVKTSFSAANIDQAFSSTAGFQKTNASAAASSFCDDCFRIADRESQLCSDGGVSEISLQQSLMESAGFLDFSCSQGPCNSPWSFGDIQESSIPNSDCSYGLFADTIKNSQNCYGDTTMCQNLGSLLHSTAGQVHSPTILNTFEELLGENDSVKSLSKYAMEDVLQCFGSVTDQSNYMVATANASGPNHTPMKIISDNQPSTSAQSSITNAFDLSEKEKCSDMFGIHKQSECLVVDVGSKNSQDWETILMPVATVDRFNFTSSNSECVTELYADRRIGTKNTLFSKLGLYDHFAVTAGGTVSAARSDFDDHSSSIAKRRKIESSSLSSNLVKCLPGFAGNTISAPSVYCLKKSNLFEPKSEVTRTSGAQSCLGDSSSVVDGNTISSPKKHEQPTKMKKKRAKPGTKQKSKDRVQIAARLADLRELIPNGEKVCKSFHTCWPVSLLDINLEGS